MYTPKQTLKWRSTFTDDFRLQMYRDYYHKIDLLRKSQVGQVCSLTVFENMGFGGLQTRPTNTYARGLISFNDQ